MARWYSGRTGCGLRWAAWLLALLGLACDVDHAPPYLDFGRYGVSLGTAGAGRVEFAGLHVEYRAAPDGAATEASAASSLPSGTASVMEAGDAAGRRAAKDRRHRGRVGRRAGARTRAPAEYAVRITNRSQEEVRACVRPRAFLGAQRDGAVLGSGRLAPGASLEFVASLPLAGRTAAAAAEVRPLVWQRVRARECARSPNIVFILVDDMGYGDLARFAPGGIDAPHLDRMAEQGMRFTNFYGEASCTPARAALMTGMYARRLGMPSAYGPLDTEGLHPDEVTIAEMLKGRGYRSIALGKWHLGQQPAFLPLAQGFDEFFGVPWSDPGPNPFSPRWPLFEGDVIVERGPERKAMTRRLTERAVRFIGENADAPFFLYLAHPMPHTPLAVSSAFEGASGRGLYHDVLLELDWSVGEVLGALDRHGLAEDTLVVFASDNGPWLRFGDHAGSAGPLREGKLTTFEGGVRVPAIARWPGSIPAGRVSDEAVGLIDMLPTFAAITGAAPPSPYAPDGANVAAVLRGLPGARNPRETTFFHVYGMLHAVRSGPLKLHVPHGYQRVVVPGVGGALGTQAPASIGLSLFDVMLDPGETVNLAYMAPGVTGVLLEEVERGRADLGDVLTNTIGAGIRAPGGRAPAAP